MSTEADAWPAMAEKARAFLDEQSRATLGVHALQASMLHMHEPPSEDKELQLDWDLYREVPASMEQEEALLLDYFRKLKFIYLEQETKLRFLADLQDDPETGQEPQILSTADVAQREQECKRVKQQLVEAKTRVRDLRTEIDTAAEALAGPYLAVEEGTAEASQLLSSITDMELELAKIKAAEGTHGAMTTEEAEAYCDEQIVSMQTLDDETTHTMHQLESAKRELQDALRTLDRLKSERIAAEKRANEAKLGRGRDKGRDWELERLCAKHTSMLETLQNALGLAAMEAPTPDELRLTFVAPSATSRSSRRSTRSSRHDDDPEARILVLQWDEPGGRLIHASLQTLQGEALSLPNETWPAYTKNAFHTNDAAGLVQAIWATCV